jgi:uncharacterized protein (UPF0335 family)
MSYCPECAKLESENVLLKQRIKDFVKDANNQTREIVRLRGIIERIDKADKENINACVAIHLVREILNEAGKGEAT